MKFIRRQQQTEVGEDGETQTQNSEDTNMEGPPEVDFEKMEKLRLKIVKIRIWK